MIRKFIKGCFFTGLLVAVFACGTIAVCCALACTKPGYYAAALAQPMTEVEVATAVSEIELMVESLGQFLGQGGAIPRQQNILPANADRLAWEATADTFAVSITERHLNAWLKMEAGAGDEDFRDPHISLQDDTIRFAATLVTSAAELALSCDFAVAKTSESDLTFELHSFRVGRLPLPAATVLKQYMRTNPVLPRDYDLNVDGDRPTLTVNTLKHNAKLQLKELKVAGGKVHCEFRRKNDSVLAAK